MIVSHIETAKLDRRIFCLQGDERHSPQAVGKEPPAVSAPPCEPQAQDLSMVLGSATHCLTFEPYAWAERYAVWRQHRGKAYKEWAEAHEAKAWKSSLLKSMPEPSRRQKPQASTPAQ